MGIFKYTFSSESPIATTNFADELGVFLGAGDVVLLQGKVGAGKSHFARSLIQSRQSRNGITEEVPSPTYTLVQTYWDGTVEIWHADLYRLSEPLEIFELGLDEAFHSAVCLVEWSERMGDLSPENALTIRFETSAKPMSRELEVTGNSLTWSKIQPWLQRVSNV